MCSPLHVQINELALIYPTLAIFSLIHSFNLSGWILCTATALVNSAVQTDLKWH